MCCKSHSALSRFGVLWGLLALATLLTAFSSSSWLYTREPVTLPNSDVLTSVTFRIGLWRICPQVKRVNTTIHMPSPACSLIKYSGWEEIQASDLGLWATLELTPTFVTRMRSCTVLFGMTLCLLLLATLFALIGHCNSDHKTLIACGLYIISALALGLGLLLYAAVLSAAYMEAVAGRKQSVSRFDYWYGWSFVTAGAAFIMAKLAALLSITAYLKRFPTVEDMVRETVPGADRKLREHHRLSSEYLLRHSGPLPRLSYEPICSSKNHPKCQAECGPLLYKTPPDVCTTGETVNARSGGFINSAMNTGSLMEGIGCAGSEQRSLAGQTVPITIKRSSVANKYGTLPHATAAPGPPPETACSSSGCYRSKTLQHQKPSAAKKCVTIGSFQTLDYSRKQSTITLSGSAV